jgi:hypothetical protein
VERRPCACSSMRVESSRPDFIFLAYSAYMTAGGIYASLR